MTISFNSAEHIWVAGNSETPGNIPRTDKELSRHQAVERAREQLKTIFGVQELLPLPPLSSHHPSARSIGYLLPADETE